MLAMGLGSNQLSASDGDAVDWAATHLDGPVVLLGSSQGGVLAMTVAAHHRRLALVAAHNVLDPALPESLPVDAVPDVQVKGFDKAVRVFAVRQDGAMRVSA